MNKETLRKYFSENLARKLAALVLLLSFSANIFAEAVPDPVSIGNARATREIITIGVGNSTIENAEKNGIGTHGEYNLTSDMTENMLREEYRCIGSACGMYKEEQFYYRIAHNTFMLNQFLATPTKTMKGGK